MIKNKQDLELITDNYRGLFDSVIISLSVSFTGTNNTSIDIFIRCHSFKDGEKTICLRCSGVSSWSFISLNNEVSEVISEGVRFELIDGKWLLDFGSDPSVDLSDRLWRDDTNKWIVSKQIDIFEVDSSIFKK